MGDVIKSQKTELWYGFEPNVASRIVCITSISGLGGARDQIETTCFDDSGDKTYTGGLGNPGQVTIGFNVHKSEVSHKALFALKDSGAIKSWGIYSSDAATQPTADTAGTIQPVVDRVSAIFDAYVADVNIDIAGNDIWRGTITLQRSGNVSWDLRTPD